MKNTFPNLGFCFGKKDIRVTWIYYCYHGYTEKLAACSAEFTVVSGIMMHLIKSMRNKNKVRQRVENFISNLALSKHGVVLHLGLS